VGKVTKFIYGVSALFVFSSPVVAELRPDIAACEELKNSEMQEQIELCKAHPGCNLIMGSKKTCASAKTFFTKLKAAVGYGTKSLFGYSMEVTSNHVFEASLSDAAKAVEQLPSVRQALEGTWWNASKETRDQQIEKYGIHALGILARVDAADKTVLETTYGGSGKAVWVGTTHGTFLTYNDKDYPDGYGVMFFDDGEIHRGRSFNYKISGDGDFLFPNGQRRIGYADNNKSHKDFDQVFAYSSGAVYQGRLGEGGRSGKGVLKWANGNVKEEGFFENDRLVTGKRYSEDGATVTVVEKPVPVVAPVSPPPPSPPTYTPPPVVVPAAISTPSKPAPARKPAKTIKQPVKSTAQESTDDACARITIVNGKKICDE
jgi:hypothetical protein